MALFDLLTLETVIHVGSTFWFQLFSVFGLTAFVVYFSEFFRWFDVKLSYYLTGMFDHWFQRKLIAPSTKVISDEWVTPDPSIKIDRHKVGHITRVTALESWLTHHPIDYSFFWDYEINHKLAKEALSRVLSRLPIIGGVWRKIDDETLGIDHTRPKVQFIYCQTDLIPSTEDSSFGKPDWYQNYMNGVNHELPFPENKPCFRVTLIHHPHKDEEKRKKGEKASMVAIGCSHALTDGEGFFMLIRAWTAEMRGEKWIVPEFDRSKLIIKQSELKTFKKDATILGKHFDYNTRPTPWIGNAIWPQRRWVAKTWTFTKPEIAALKEKALNGKVGEKLKKMRLSTNDIIVALFWKLKATLNRDYEYSHPTICALAINTRKWLPNRFPKYYFGNALAFLLLSKTRKELIDADFSEACLMVREAVSSLKVDDFEDDLHFYPYILKKSPKGLNTLHRYHARWAVGGHAFDYAKYIMDRDILVSNLIKFETFKNLSFGNGDPCRVRFNFQDDASSMSYAFKLDPKCEVFEYFTSIPVNDLEFYNTVNIKDPKLDWAQINRKYARETKRWIRRYPGRRIPIVNPSALFDGKPNTKFWTW